MARSLKFVDDDKSRERYALLYLALVNSERKNTNADLRVITDLTRELQSVGDEVEKVGRVPLYDLKDGITDGTVELETSEYKMLLSLIEHTRWSSGMAPQVVELQDWLKNAPREGKEKSAESEAPAGTPQAGQE